jgi:hypothetical protein
MAKSIPELSIEVQLLVKRLSLASVGETIEYGELCAVASQDVWHKSQHKLHSARRIVERDFGMVFVAVSGVGLKRISEPEKVDLIGHGAELIHKKTTKLVKKAGTVDLSQLDKPKVSEFNVRVSQLGAAVESAGHQLPLAKTIEAFK